MIQVEVVVLLIALKPVTNHLWEMHLLDDKLNANLDFAAVAMLLYTLCCNADKKIKIQILILEVKFHLREN